MLRRTCTRLALRRSDVPRAVSLPGQKQAFGFGEVAPKGAPGFSAVEEKPPETISDTVKYISKGMTTVPRRKEIVEALGYPGQKHSAGCISTVGRIYYGPGRYDYGRPKMPKSWFANFFYGFWEFGHLMFVADRWISMRFLRHFLGIAFCFFPFWLQMNWNIEAWKEFKEKYPN
eukprot:TRINITY_DN1013_c0_g2_i1.p1 TRINITY_DN1013_c0_g2~~TRINITY_DN1013_c0_g2_i1.p1  ORF type:complete len:199 (+),score=39.80 TRINITY_DN1013_c0_g2_i1:77-598(+)